MMKKLSILIISAILLLTSCGTGTPYPHENIGIYDTTTKQNINIGMSKNDVDKILGYGDADEYSNYPNNLTIKYSDDNKVESISIYYDRISFMPPVDNSRYTLNDGLNCNSTVTEFIENYKPVYEDSSPQFQDNPDVCVFAEKQNGKLSIVDKKRVSNLGISALQNNLEYDGDLYKISLTYSSYDEIKSIDVEKVIYPYVITTENLKEIK